MVMKILDTQIVSYAFKKTYKKDIQQAVISSITANEFLLTQGEYNYKARYYIPLLNKLAIDFENKNEMILKRDHPFIKSTTDQIILDFQQEHPSIILFNNLSVSEVINRKLFGLFRETISFLDKKQQKTLKKRFLFLIEHNVQCIPVTRKVIPMGLELLSKFIEKYNPKDDFRNTVNDTLILASALDAHAVLITQDNLLSRFAVNYLEGHSTAHGDFLEINFRNSSFKERRNNSESKGYINRGWQYSVRNHRKPAN